MDEDIAHVSVSKYLQSHTKPNGGWRGFLHSNLFSALIIWFLSQTVVIGGLLVTLWIRSAQLSEWKGRSEARNDRMEAERTKDHYLLNEHEKQLTSYETRMKAVEADTGHLDVLESEHRRLTKDVEDLKLHEKK